MEKFNRIAYLVALAIMFIGVTLMYALTPLMCDDLWYMMTSSGANTKLEALSFVWNEDVNHWFSDTGRLANLINGPFLIIVPKWLFGIISASLTIVIVELSRRLADVRVGSVSSWIIIFGMVFLLPWLDYMFTVVFALNYIWTCAISLLSLYFVIKRVPETNAGMIGASICCLIAGWMHEGFMVPLMGGLALWFLMTRKLNRRQMILLGAWMLGGILIVISPAFWHRTGGVTSGLLKFVAWEKLASGLVYNCMTFIYLFVLIYALISAKIRRKISADSGWAFAVLCLGVCIVGSALYYMFYLGARMSFIMQLFGTIGVAWVVRYVGWVRRNAVSIVAALFVILCMTVHYAESVLAQIVLQREFYEIVRLYKSEPTGQIFYDNIKPKVDFTLLRPSYRVFNELLPQEEFSYYYGPDRPNLTIIPTALKHIDLAKVTFGDDSTLFVYEGFILYKHEKPEPTSILVEGEDGLQVPTRVKVKEFFTQSGEHYFLVVPHLQYSPVKIKYKSARILKRKK